MSDSPSLSGLPSLYRMFEAKEVHDDLHVVMETRLLKYPGGDWREGPRRTLAVCTKRADAVNIAAAMASGQPDIDKIP